MAPPDRILGMYLHLARASHARQQPMVRDKLLIMAGVQAQEMGLEEISALCRHKILAHNSRHLIRRWSTLNAALADERFQSYLKQLRRRYSAEKIEHMLHSLGIELGRERDAYFSDLEYAASLLDTQPEKIAGILAQPPGNKSGLRADAAANSPDTARRPRWLLNVLVVWIPLVTVLVALAALAILVRRD